ncbi:hypothetical protein PCO31110_03649 [Pandoraea communis]|uniref:Uncharacterized protein n=1 Tax=Pandoraea communis TaxID=2508297 RepID=A0A5E4X206_9BURK|nr:hypothetical protein [Pandoraea communis]VVE30332.1 hypothetical protein PCO31110_03649 [Pandoraea communis]
MENCSYEVVIDNERFINKPVVALTKCQIKFRDRDSLHQCVEEIRKSDLRLSLRPEEDVQYDWQNPVGVRGNTLHFGVRWFDAKYFSEHRDVYLNEMHKRLLNQFGVDMADANVEHFVASH